MIGTTMEGSGLISAIQGLFNVHQNYSTQAFLKSIPIRLQLWQQGIVTVTSHSEAQYCNRWVAMVGHQA